ncbi:hypothetical protein VR46_03795, partial [Streptomyces sp. NRRL S-444]
MLMYGDRAIGVLADPDQWLRCRHESTALLDEGGVGLAWEPEPESGPDPGTAVHGPAGLAFDRWGRAYRSYPRAGRVEVLPPGGGEGAPHHRPGTLCVPRGLAVDGAQRLFIAESGAGAVHVVDLWGERLLRRVPVRSADRPHRRPLDVTAHCGAVAVLVTRPAGIVLLQGRRGPLRGPVLHPPPGSDGLRPTRIADHAGHLHVLWTGAAGGHAVVARADGTRPLVVGDATDLDLTADGALVVARAPGQPFRRFRTAGGAWAEIEPLRAPGYDGGAVTVDPQGRVAFTTADGLARTAGPAARYTL